MFTRRSFLREDPIEEESPQLRSYSKKREPPVSASQVVTKQAGNVQGVNAAISTMTFCQVGSGDALSIVNLSAQPGQKKRLVSVTGAQTFLVNYAQSQYPSRITLMIDQIGGMTDKAGNSTKIVAVLTPEGAAVPVYNSGGVIGYNVAYKLLGQAIAWDISNLPILTFKVAIGADLQPVTYPLAEPLTFNLQVTRVMF